ncbi:MAG: D-2-hydroxyacid dehydrogenase [Clostridia bacterium]|nr:D-2-hydroxyacid dehydrogenase [Clostridia bacterium]
MDKKLKAVILDGYTENPGDISWSCIEQLVDLTVYPRTSPDKIIERGKDADILIVNKVAITRELLEHLPNLKFVATLATGYNQLDCQALKEKCIPVSNIPAYSTNAVAQMVFAYILELINKVSEYTADVKSGTWCKCEDFCYWNSPLYELDGKTLGIIGFGKIGARVSRIAAAFGMRVLCYTPSGKKDGFPDVEFTDMDTVISNSDFISVHCPLTPDTAGLINKDFICRMKKASYIINTARGPVANEKDVAEALKNGTLAGYGTDVLSTEPPEEDNPLLSAPNCLITPHIAWAAYETRVRLMGILEQNIKAYLNGAPINVVNN